MIQRTDEASLKSRVAQFWDNRPCGSFASDEELGTRAFFDEVASYRYSAQPFMRELIGFHRFTGKRVLEAGCGLGTDLRQFALAGADVVGLDLSASSVKLAQQHFLLSDTEGAFCRGDVERIAFADESFDAVYSFGVLQHTPNTQAGIDECWRVLKPGGRFILMLNNRRSWHVIVEPYLQAAKRMLLRQRVSPDFADPLSVVLRYHGDKNPLGKAYTPCEVSHLLRRFEYIQIRIRDALIVNGSLLGRGYSRFLEWSRINRRWGFWIIAEARRPARNSRA